MFVALTLATFVALIFLAVRGISGSSDEASTTPGVANLNRQDFTQTWTGAELVIWGGWGTGEADGRVLFGDGAAYDPEAATWRQIAPAPISARWGHSAFWDGDEVVIMGGVDVSDGAAYNPANDSWRKLSATTPYDAKGWNIATSSNADELVVWLGRSGQMWSYSSDRDGWTELPPLPIVVDAARVLHVGDRLAAIGLPLPTKEQLVQTAVLAAERVEWQVVEELPVSSDGLSIGELDAVAVRHDDADESIIMWGSASGPNAWRLSDAFVWEPAPSPGLTACDGAPEIAFAGDDVIVRSFCDSVASVRSTTSDDDWRTVDFPSDSDPAPVWTGDQLIGLGFGGEIYTW